MEDNKFELFQYSLFYLSGEDEPILSDLHWGNRYISTTAVKKRGSFSDRAADSG